MSYFEEQFSNQTNPEYMSDDELELYAIEHTDFPEEEELEF